MRKILLKLLQGTPNEEVWDRVCRQAVSYAVVDVHKELITRVGINKLEEIVREVKKQNKGYTDYNLLSRLIKENSDFVAKQNDNKGKTN